MAIRFQSGALRTVAIFVAVVVIICWAALRTNVFAANVSASWDYNFDPQPGCSALQSTNCIDHFEVGDITNQQKFVFIQSVSIPNPAKGKVDHISTSFRYGPPFFQRTISVVAVSRGPNGERVTSNPFAARATVVIRPGAKPAVIF